MLRNRFYFSVKPWLPRRLRIGLRRLRARWILRRNGHAWPISQEAARKPDNWAGWPQGRQFALVLTHDVEGTVGVERVEALASLEMELGFRSSYNFVPEGSYRVSRRLRDFLTGNGFEVGVHDLYHDGKLYSSRSAFRRRAHRINQYLQEWGAVGFRSGFMLHNLEWLGDLRVEYDASTFDTDPFEPQPDGVNSIFPFWVSRRRWTLHTADATADVRLERGAGGYVELPYTLPQDMTIFILLQERTADIWKRKLRWIVDQGGMALLNVHPDYVDLSSSGNRSLEFPAELYTDFLRFIRDNYAGQYWAALPKEIAAWYRNSRQVPAESVSTEAATGEQ